MWNGNSTEAVISADKMTVLDKSQRNQTRQLFTRSCHCVIFYPWYSIRQFPVLRIHLPRAL